MEVTARFLEMLLAGASREDLDLVVAEAEVSGSSPALLDAPMPMPWLPAAADAAEATVSVVPALLPGLNASTLLPSCAVQPAGTLPARLKLVAEQAALSRLVTLTP